MRYLLAANKWYQPTFKLFIYSYIPRINVINLPLSHNSNDRAIESNCFICNSYKFM
jgi:hypothetical protein